MQRGTIIFAASVISWMKFKLYGRTDRASNTATSQTHGHCNCVKSWNVIRLFFYFSQVEMFECPFCFRTFPKELIISNHMKDVHKILLGDYSLTKQKEVFRLVNIAIDRL